MLRMSTAGHASQFVAGERHVVSQLMLVHVFARRSIITLSKHAGVASTAFWSIELVAIKPPVTPASGPLDAQFVTPQLTGAGA
jgi:hypothetical protein